MFLELLEEIGFKAKQLKRASMQAKAKILEDIASPFFCLFLSNAPHSVIIF